MSARVLLVDGDAARRSSIAARLVEYGHELVAAATDPDDAAVLTERHRPDVVVAELATMGDDGPAWIDAIRAAGTPTVRIVVVAPAGPSSPAAALVAAGVRALVADDGLPAIGATVEAVASGARLLSPDVAGPVLDELARLYEREKIRNDELQELVSQLESLSVTDWLTGLKNHGYFFERLGEELDRSLRHRRPVAVILADIDDFKQVNDTKGHAAGDRVLQAVGHVLIEALRSADIVCRLGGEEFGLLLPETDAAGAYLVAERIRESVAALAVSGVGTFTISLGVAAAPEHAIDRDELIETADRALYLAKREGKNRTRVAGQDVSMQAPPVGRPLRGEIVELLVRVLRLRDPHLAERAVRTAEVAVALGAHLRTSAGELEHLRVAGLLQDVGKIGVADSILFKRGPLSESEWFAIREHPRRGFDLIGRFVHPDVAEAVLANHERWDGQGYPRGLRGEEIPLLARILLVADAYAAMTVERPFKAAMSGPEALDELRRNAGLQFDATVVEAMAELAVTLERDDGANRYVATPRQAAEG